MSSLMAGRSEGDKSRRCGRSVRRKQQEEEFCAGEAGEKRPKIAATKEKQVKSDRRGGH
jgi:hypothetical protein